MLPDLYRLKKLIFQKFLYTDMFIDETLQTLQYASRVKVIKNKPVASEADELRFLRAAIMELQAAKRLAYAGRAIADQDDYVRALAVADQERLVKIMSFLIV